MSAPLAGVRVIDLTTVVVGPPATLFIADYGADVIKVEAPGGDLLRSLGGTSKSGQLSGKFTHFNRNKRSLALDLKQKPARELLEKLLATADVFIANIREAALARLGEDKKLVILATATDASLENRSLFHEIPEPSKNIVRGWRFKPRRLFKTSVGHLDPMKEFCNPRGVRRSHF